MKKLHLLQSLTIGSIGTDKVYSFKNSNKPANNGIFVFDLFELLKAFNEKLLIIFANIRV